MLRTSAQTAAIVAAGRLIQGRVSKAAGAEPDSDAIWDAHTHLSGVSGTVEQRVDGLLAYADRMGIERLVVFMGTSFVADPSPDELRRQNDEVLRAIEHRPDRVLGMVYLNPKHTQASLDELQRCVADGPMIGVKLWIAMQCRHPELDPLVRRAVELQVPLLQHAYRRVDDNLPGESSPRDVAILADRHPDASFICAHTGNDWERGIRAIRAAPNVWAEICGSDPTAGFVEMAVRELGAERVIYGSDAGGRSFASQLAKVYSANLPDAARRLVLGGNLRRLLAPALAARGVEL
jgi:predicted TIM-barrel fold metal-dependent hydrolase